MCLEHGVEQPLDECDFVDCVGCCELREGVARCVYEGVDHRHRIWSIIVGVVECDLRFCAANL